MTWKLAGWKGRGVRAPSREKAWVVSVGMREGRPVEINIKIFLTIFLAILFAELGDKTQLATLLFATNEEHSKLTVFLASAAALVVASGLAVALGDAVSRFINPKYLAWLAGAGFIVVGVWTILRA